jgi:hypothetical protein
MGIAEPGHATAFGVFGETGFEGDFTHVVARTA